MGGVARSKITVPGPPSGLVRRPALLDALDRGAGCPLTLVCAPPGYGKTVLLAQWAADRDEPCAWDSLDEEDDDPRHLWSSVVAALADLPGAPSPNPLHRLVVPRTSVGVDFLTDLLEAVDALPGPVRVVLDDAHHLRSAETMRGLRFFLRN